MKTSNEQLYQAIKIKILDDLNIAYEVFKEEGFENLGGVILQLNSTKGFGEYIKNEPKKLSDFLEHLYTHLDFLVHITFGEHVEEEFFPLLD